MPHFKKSLDELERKGRLRALKLPTGIDLTSNDYLGMANHPALKETAITALENGLEIGAAGSRLLRGHTPSHAALESFAVTHFKAGGALYFSSGFQANYALLTTLPQRKDVVLYDEFAHASMRDGLQAAKYKSYKFAHNDLNALEDLLKRHRTQTQNTWIAIETLYSMDGDRAPLNEIYALAEQYDAYLIADEAHSTGVYGEQGKGLCWDIINQYGYDRLITLHTCGKAIGVSGGLVCASKDIVDYLINAARPFIYSTAPMPLQALLVQRSLEVLASEEGALKRKKLHRLSVVAKDMFGGAGTQIIPIIIGGDVEALETAARLKESGFDIRAIRPPTVPEETARLRLSLSSELDETVLQNVCDALKSHN